MNITNEMIEQSYFFGKKVFSDEISKDQAELEINTITGMNVGSACNYITVLLAMLKGDEYHRTININATQYYLDNIQKDFGLEVLIKAVQATENHTKHYKTLGKGRLKSIMDIVAQFKERYKFE